MSDPVNWRKESFLEKTCGYDEGERITKTTISKKGRVRFHEIHTLRALGGNRLYRKRIAGGETPIAISSKNCQI